MAKNELLTIKQICSEFDLSQVYVRRAMQKGWLESHTVPFNRNQVRRVAKREHVEAWRAKAETKARRTDGRRKYKLYATAPERAKLAELVAESGLEVIIELANPPKK